MYGDSRRRGEKLSDTGSGVLAAVRDAEAHALSLSQLRDCCHEIRLPSPLLFAARLILKCATEGGAENPSGQMEF